MAFIAKEELYLTMGHEYLHAGFNAIGFNGMHNRQHVGIYKWECFQASAWNYRVDYYQQRYNKVKNILSGGLRYDKLGFIVYATTIF